MQGTKLIRSALYLPAVNARAVEKSRSLPADCVILDLEDSVAPEAKPQAREAAAAALKSGGFGAKYRVIRVNGLDTPFGREDLRAAGAAAPDAVLLPKVSDPETILEASTRLAEAGAPRATRLWAMIETPRAILGIHAIAASRNSGVGARLSCFVMGVNDLAKEMRLSGRATRARLGTSIELALLAARAEGLTILDGVYNDIADAAGFEAECRDGQARGFDGKSLIHPSQVEPCNRAYAPDPEALAEARAILAAFAAPEAQGKGVVTLNGKMVERLHLAEAERLLALARTIEGREA